MIKRLYLLLFALTPILSQAQYKLPDNIFKETLPNGLVVLVIEDSVVPMATVMITCKNGSFTESPQFNGLSHLYEHMFFKANEDYNDDKFDQQANALGLNYNGETQTENVNYYFTFPSDNLLGALRFMNSAIRYPKFKRSDIKKENTVVDDEFKDDESNPDFALNDAMNHHMWGDLYSRKNPIGNHQVVQSATPAMMDSIKNKYYYPNNCMLTIAGDVKHEDVFKQAEQIYGNWKVSAFNPFKQWPIPEFKPLEKTDYFIVESPLTHIPIIQLQWQGPDTRNDVNATYAADVLAYILDQASSSFNKALVQSGLALQANMSYSTQNHVGPITITVVPDPDKIQYCLTELKKQLTLIGTNNYITDGQLIAAKRKMEIRQIKLREVTTEFVHTMSYWWASASIDYYAGYIDNIKQVTLANLQNYVHKYITQKPYCAALLISPELREKTKSDTFFIPGNK